MLPLPDLLRLGDVFLLSFAVSAIAAYPIYRLLIAWKSRQTVSQHAPEGHQKKQGTPTMGGLIIVAGALGALGFHAFRLSGDGHGTAMPLVIAPIVLLIGFGLIGFTDDFLVPRLFAGKRGLGWKQKILMQVAIAAATMGYLTNWELGTPFWLGVFFVLFFSNAYNFSDGLDGLAGSLLIGLGLGLAALAVHADLPVEVTITVAALMGGALPFLFFNAPPAKVFMGDVGSLPIGACLGLVVTELMTGRDWVVYSLFPEGAGMPPIERGIPDIAILIPLVIVSFVMIAELVPVPLQILSVKIRKKKLFTFTPIHHAFEAKGWPESRVVWTFALTQLVLSGAALYVFLRMLEARVGQP